MNICHRVNGPAGETAAKIPGTRRGPGAQNENLPGHCGNSCREWATTKGTGVGAFGVNTTSGNNAFGVSSR